MKAADPKRFDEEKVSPNLTKHYRPTFFTASLGGHWEDYIYLIADKAITIRLYYIHQTTWHQYHLLGRMNLISYSSPYFLNFLRSTSCNVIGFPFSTASNPLKMALSSAVLHFFLNPLSILSLSVMSGSISR